MEASLEAILLLCFVGFTTVFGIGILVSAYSRYRVKRTRLARTLLTVQVYMNLFIIASLVSALFGFSDIHLLLDEASVSLYLADNPVMVLTYTFIYQLVTLPFLPVIYYLYVFARSVFMEEEKGGKLAKWVNIIFAVAIIIQILINGLLLYAIACSLSGLPIDYYDSLVSLSVTLLVLIVAILNLVLSCIVFFPISLKSIRLWKRTPSEDPHKLDLFYIGAMAFASIIGLVFNLVDIILQQNGFTYPTPAFLIVWICVPTTVYTAYRGYFASKPRK